MTNSPWTPGLLTPTMPGVALGALIRRHRKILLMSQSTLAQKASISQPYVCQIETGLQTPGVNTLLKIMDILLIDPADIPQFTEVSE